MEDALTQLALACQVRQEAGLLAQGDGTVLLAYPLKQGTVVGIGTGPGSEHMIRSVLRKRSEDLRRLGRWLPVLFNDGSCFVMIRVDDIPADRPVVDSEMLAAARELIS